MKNILNLIKIINARRSSPIFQITLLLCIILLHFQSYATQSWENGKYQICEAQGSAWIKLDSCEITDTLILRELNDRIFPFLKKIKASPDYNFLSIGLEDENFFQILVRSKDQFKINCESIKYYQRLGYTIIDGYLVILREYSDSNVSFFKPTTNMAFLRYEKKYYDDEWERLNVMDDSVMYWQYKVIEGKLVFYGDFLPTLPYDYEQAHQQSSIPKEVIIRQAPCFCDIQ